MTLLTVFVGIIAACNLLVLLAITLLAFAMKKFFDTSARTAMAEARAAIKNINKMVDKVEDRAERIMDIGETTAKRVSVNVEATSDVLEETITGPFVQISSFLAGLSKAIQTWRSVSARS